MIIQSTREATREELIERIEELQLEIEELKQDNSKQWKERCKLSFEVDDSIPKQVIKNKIEELEEEKLCFYSDYAIEERNCKIEVLKELLESEE